MFVVAIPFALVIAGGVAYHLTLRAAAGGSPWAVLAPAYGLAALVCAAMWARAGGRVSVPAGRALGVAGGLALSLVAIEAGYLLVYRSGWAMSSVTAVTSTSVVAALAVVGLVLGESFTGGRALGLGLAAAGVWLMLRGRH